MSHCLQQKLRQLLVLSTGGAAAFSAICLYQNDARFYSRAVMPVAHRVLDAERAHELMVWALGRRLVPKEKEHKRTEEDGGAWTDDDIDLVRRNVFAPPSNLHLAFPFKSKNLGFCHFGLVFRSKNFAWMESANY